MCLWYRVLNIQNVHSDKIQFGACVYNCREELHSRINKSKLDYLCADSRAQACAYGQRSVLTGIHLYELWLKRLLGRKIINTQLNIHQYSLPHKSV